METVEWDREVYEKLKRFINSTSSIYDKTDIADFIMDYRDEILKIIK